MPDMTANPKPLALASPREGLLAILGFTRHRHGCRQAGEPVKCSCGLVEAQERVIAAAQSLEAATRLADAVKYVLETFQRDEAQGYRSKDRQFAIEVLTNQANPKPSALASPREGLADKVIQRVAELPDRTSPDDWPDAMLVTADELRVIVAEEAAQSLEAATLRAGRAHDIAMGLIEVAKTEEPQTAFARVVIQRLRVVRDELSALLGDRETILRE